MNGSEPVQREYPPIPIVSAHALIFREGGHIRFHYVVIYSLARYVEGEVHPQSDALEVRWAAREELDALDMHPLVRETVRRAFEGADGGVSE